MNQLRTAARSAPNRPRRQLGCQPWCTSHANGTPADQTPDPADQLCTHTVTSPAFDEFLLSHSERDSVMVGLYSTRQELTLAQFEQLCLLGLAAIAAARSREVAA